MVKTVKTCKKCGVEKPLDQFYVSRGYVHGWCKPCDLARNAAWQEAHTAERSAKRTASRQESPKEADARTLKLYGVSPEQKQATFIKQGGVCAICGEKKPLQVDHCHTTKKFRGLLCWTCNATLGKFSDSADRFERAAKYLRK